MPRCVLFAFRCACVCVLVVLIGTVASLSARQPPELKGDAILKHPIGQLALKAADLMRAGKTDEVIALGTKASLAEWKKATAEERTGVAAMMKRQAPSAAYAEQISKVGVLVMMPAMSILRVDLGAAGLILAYFEQEGGQWRLTNGPMVTKQ